jgi:hypothetical protein
MRIRVVARAVAHAAFGSTIVLGAAAAAQPTTPATQPPEHEEILVLGKRLEELRIRIERAEDDVYARFNEINSDDLFDVHCYERGNSGSRIEQRRCLSNGWRQMDIAFADATVRDLQSAGVSADAENTAPGAGYSHIPQQYRAKQLRTEQIVSAEMRRLAHDDPQLRAAMERLGQAYQAEEQLTGLRPEWTLYREVATGKDGLPFGAEHLFEVRIGATEWSQSLRARTFTIAGVDGRIREMRITCDKADRKLEYQEDVDWTLPEGWGACTLHVNAKRGTTFALYEFE